MRWLESSHNNFTEQKSTLNGIRTLAGAIPEKHTTAMDKLDELGPFLASVRMSGGHM